MKALIAKTLNIQPEETYLVLVLGLILFNNSLARQISDVVAVSGFLSTVGVNQILIVWAIDMVLTILVTAGQSLVVDRFKRVHLISAMSFVYALLLIALRLMFAFGVASGINYTVLYLLAEQQLLFFPLVFWILASDLVSMVQAKRLFPLIATGNFIGQIAGLGIAAIAPTVLALFNYPLEALLTFNGLIYLFTGIITLITLNQVRVRQTNRRPENAVETLTEGWGFVREVPAFKYLMIAIIAINICLTIFEFRFLAVSNESFGDIQSYQRFYSLFRLVLISLAFLTQGFLTGRILRNVNLKNCFFMLPSAQVIASTIMLLSPGLIGGVGGFSLSKLTQVTLDESTRKSFQSLVPEERRGRVSLFMDCYLFAAGTLIGCLVMGIILILGHQVPAFPTSYVYLSIALITSLFTVWIITQMRSVYDKSLLNWRLKRRQRSASILDKLDSL
jgi:ATP/ADP translocase